MNAKIIVVMNKTMMIKGGIKEKDLHYQ